MGGERNLSRLSQPKADYPLLARKPVGKLIDNLYLGRIEREYKDGQYGKFTLAASVSPLDYPSPVMCVLPADTRGPECMMKVVPRVDHM